MIGKAKVVWRRLLITSLLLLSGCATKKPIGYKFSGCVVTNSWVDEEGRTRKDCDCPRGLVVGWDAKTQTQIVRCRP